MASNPLPVSADEEVLNWLMENADALYLEGTAIAANTPLTAPSVPHIPPVSATRWATIPLVSCDEEKSAVTHTSACAHTQVFQ